MRDYGECICNIKQKLADAWNMANEAIKKVKVNGTVYSPDGTGTVDLGTIKTEIPTASEVPSTDGNVQTDIDGIKASVTANATAIATETTERTDADETLQANIDAVGSTAASNASAIATESTTRADADSALQSAVDTLTTNLATETTERTDADDVLKNDLDLLSVEVAKKQNITMSDGRTVENAIGALDDEVGSETDAGTILNRIAKNETAISDETTARRNEDTALASDIADNATAIANEVTARTEADNTLQTAIDEINDSISTNASNIASNKTEIDANAAAIAGKQDALTAGDGISIAENVVSNSGVTSIVAGDNITIDNSTGAVTINAEGGGTEYTAGNGISISDNIISTSLFTGGGLSYSASTKQLMLTGISAGYNYTQQITIDANSSVVALGAYDYGCVNSANILTKSQDDLTGLTYEVRPYGSSYNTRYTLYLINHTDNSITLTLKLTAYVGYNVRTGNYPTFIPELESEFEYQQGLINAQKQDILTAGDGISISDDNVISCTATGGSGTTVPTITTYNSLTEFRAALQYGDEVLIRAPFTITQVGNPNTSYTNQAVATLRLIAQDTDTLIGSIVLPYTTSLTSKVGIVVNTGDITITDTQLSFSCWYINYNGPGQWTAIITPASGYSESNYEYRIIRH